MGHSARASLATHSPTFHERRLRWIHDALPGKRLIKVVRSLYLNRMTTTAGKLEEAAV